MKKGAPIAEVITPKGSCAGAMIDLAIKSDKDNIIAPKSAAPGIKNLCLGPIKSLTKCGVTNPTKPIIPQNETEIPTIIEVIKMIFFFRVSTSKPK